MELELTSDQEFFAETTRRFIGDKIPVAELRAKRDDPTGFTADLWRQGAELGWTSLLVSEEDGGGSMSGRPIADITLLAHEFGSQAAPGPLSVANIVAGALSLKGSADQKSGPLAEILAGQSVATWADSEPRPSQALTVPTTAAEIRGDKVVLNGVKAPVESAADAKYILVTANTDGGVTQVLVPSDAEGVTIEAMGTVDLTRRFAKVTLDSVELPVSAVVGVAGAEGDTVDRQRQVIIAIELAQMVGAMDTAFKLTVEWAFDRYSFGRPLASYQELKHRFADMKMWLDASHGLADGAARAIQDGDADVWELLSAGKAYIGHYGNELVHDCVQMHGGIGVTFEHDMHLYVRRVVLGSGLHGTVHDHRLRLTTLLEQNGEAA